MLPQSIPIVQTTDRNINQLQQNIIPVIKQICQNQILQGQILTNQSLIAGSNTIVHGLNRVLQGWICVRVRASATIFDTQNSNPSPSSTLLLTTDNPVVVDILVF